MSNDIKYALSRMRRLVEEVEAYYIYDIQLWIDCNFMEQRAIERTTGILKALAQKHNLNNKKFTTNIQCICNAMAEELLQILRRLIDSNPFFSFIVAFALFNRHLSLTYEVLFWYKEKHLLFNIDDSDVRKQLNSYFSRIKDKKKFNELFYRLQCYLASEKYTLRLLLEISHDNLAEMKKTAHTEMNISEILEYSRALGKIIMIRDQASKGIGCVKELEFDFDGEIYLKQKENLSFSLVGNKFLRWTTNRECNKIPDDIMGKLNFLCNKFIGYSIEELYELIEALTRRYSSYSGGIIIFLSKKEWQEELKALINKNEVEINKLLGFISREPVGDFDYIRNKQNKILQKSIFFYQDSVIVSLKLLISSLMSLINDVFYNNIELEEFHRQLEKIHEEINEKFEIETYELLKNSLAKNIIHNFNKIGDKPPYIVPPGQIDILLYYDNDLYVVECKNYELKTNISSVANEVKRIHKDEMCNLEKKINFVNENLEKILPLLGIEAKEAKNINDVVGLFVTKNFSMGEVFSNQFPIVNSCSLIGWIKSRGSLSGD